MLYEHGAHIITLDYSEPGSGVKRKEQETRLTLNLKNKKIRDFVLMHIVPKVDIIIEGFRPGVMERFGLAPSSVHRVNPKVIYVRISGYG
jgi:alpha-methylacyl-CoA racemase